MQNDQKQWLLDLICSIMPNVQKTFKEYYGLEFNVPLKIDVKFGKTWLEAKQDE